MIEDGAILGPIRVSSGYSSKAMLPDNAPSGWNQDFINCVIDAESRHEPEELLPMLKRIEQHLGRKNTERWAPRQIDIDIIDYEDRPLNSDDLKIPHPGMLKRSFVVEPLKELFPKEKKYQVHVEGLECQKIATAILPVQIVGILNITPDSFSDGNRFFDTDRALTQCQRMMHEGASIVDIGAESTRPGADVLKPEEEFSRIEPFLKDFVTECLPSVGWSLDSRNPQTVERALEFNPTQLNDVSCGADPQMIGLWKQVQQDIVIMHNLGIPADRSKVIPSENDPIDIINEFFFSKLSAFEKEGLPRRRFIIDPGVGFGKSAEQSIDILRRLDELKAVHREVYVGHSRKSFLNLVTDSDFSKRDLETHLASALSLKHLPSYLRVHDVEGTVRAVKTALLFI